MNEKLMIILVANLLLTTNVKALFSYYHTSFWIFYNDGFVQTIKIGADRSFSLDASSLV